MCQTLGYHRSRFSTALDAAKNATQEHLFWTVYKLDKSLAFRLGRPSYFRDAEITLPIDLADESVRIARTQGRVYDELYSPASLSRPASERGIIAQSLATELRNLINETHSGVSVRPSNLVAHFNHSPEN
jgi:hypothetical protein